MSENDKYFKDLIKSVSTWPKWKIRVLENLFNFKLNDIKKQK